MHHSEATDTFWALCQLTMAALKPQWKAISIPQIPVNLVPCPLSFAALCTFQKNIMSVDSIGIGIISS